MNPAGGLLSPHWMLLGASLPICLHNTLQQLLQDSAPVCSLGMAPRISTQPPCSCSRALCLPKACRTMHASRKDRLGPFHHVTPGPRSCPAPMKSANSGLWLELWFPGQSLPQSILWHQHQRRLPSTVTPRGMHLCTQSGLVSLTDELFTLMRPRWPV